MAYRRGRGTGRSYRSGGYRSFGSGRTRARTTRRRSASRAAPAVRLVIEHTTASPVSRPSMQPFIEKNPGSTKSKF